MWRDGIGISVICPGFVRSRITDGNQFIMPMFMEASDAARIIAKGLARNKSLIAFPFRMYLLMWLISALPSWLVDRLSRNLPDKE
jgi:short-subunit dehydrogenase